MSDYLGNLADLLYATGTTTTTSAANATRAATSTSANTSTESTTTDRTTLSFEDYLNLMCVTLENQTIDDTADMSEMMNQLVQMSVVTAINNIQEQISEAMTLINDATTLTYASSLVGKEVTIGIYDSDGNLQEFYGTVTATGALDGEQVIFLEDGNCYYLSSIMAIGRLPEGTSEESAETVDSAAEESAVAESAEAQAV